MSRNIIGLLCLFALCSCGFFERESLSEEEILTYIFSSNKLPEAQVDVHSSGAVGGYGFVLRVEANSAADVVSQLDGFDLTSSYSGDDPNRNLVVEIFRSSVAQHFYDLQSPDWIPQEATCANGVSLYKKEKVGLMIHAYRGVGACNEVFFIGTID